MHTQAITTKYTANNIVPYRAAIDRALEIKTLQNDCAYYLNELELQKAEYRVLYRRDLSGNFPVKGDALRKREMDIQRIFRMIDALNDKIAALGGV